MCQCRLLLIAASLVAVLSASIAADGTAHVAAAPPELQNWLQPQSWQRDTNGAIVRLGEPGRFDDTHIFAPCVARIGGEYRLWYSGSSGTVAERVFDLGLASSADGRVFQKSSVNPVYRFGDGKHSVLTATLLRSPDGSVLREGGKLRMWFSSTHFSGGTGHHALYETQSVDGISWSKPSEPLLDHVYAPTILKEGLAYRMWYTDVSSDPWVMRLATSRDGRQWHVHPEPLLQPEAEWEKTRLFYPCVLKADGVYLMWYGSYWTARPNTTAIGLAASLDGRRWYRNPHNPVLRPDPERPWESHYTTSQSVIRHDDGSFRIWYASRTKPPFVNKYFAINTATWAGPELPSEPDSSSEKAECQQPTLPTRDAGDTYGSHLRGTPAAPIANGTMTVHWKDPVTAAASRHVLVHFHGAPETVGSAFSRSGVDAILVVVNFRGLSSAYSKPFASDTTLFSRILGRARAAFSASGAGGDADDWQRVSVSSFSAGYGAVREILKTPELFDSIDAIVAADSIYAGLQSEQPVRQVDEQQMRDFLRFASLAATGKKSFVLSHSAQPTPYASTTETADYLLDALMMGRNSDSTIATPTWKQATAATRRGFVVLGFEGESGPDHLQHLRNIDLLWNRLSDVQQ